MQDEILNGKKAVKMEESVGDYMSSKTEETNMQHWLYRILIKHDRMKTCSMW